MASSGRNVGHHSRNVTYAHHEKRWQTGLRIAEDLATA
jgi:hypothetical protein